MYAMRKSIVMMNRAQHHWSSDRSQWSRGETVC